MTLTTIDGSKGQRLANPVGDSNLRPPEAPPNWCKTRDGLQLRVWKEPFDPPRPRKPKDWYFDLSYSQRELHFTIAADNDRVVAAGHFTQWRQNFPPEELWEELDIPDIDTFRVVAEAHSRHAADMSEVVFRMWGRDPFYDDFDDDENYENFFDCGDLLVFERLRINAISMCESITAWLLIGDLIKRLSQGGHRAALMILKAFPLEFEDTAPDNARKRKQWQRRLEARQQAMRRLYQQRLGMKPMPAGEYGEWMWCALRFGPKPPKLTRRKDPVER